jgi:hypothetical protein
MQYLLARILDGRPSPWGIVAPLSAVLLVLAVACGAAAPAERRARQTQCRQAHLVLNKTPLARALRLLPLLHRRLQQRLPPLKSTPAN